MAVRSRLSFDSIGSMSMWPASHTAAAATLEHLVQENKELRQKFDSSEATRCYSKLLQERDERTTLYVAPDALLAKVCNRLELENQRQAQQIITLSAQLSGSASAGNATHLAPTTIEAGHDRQWQREAEGDMVASEQQGTQDLPSLNQLPTALKGASKMIDWVSPSAYTSAIVPCHSCIATKSAWKARIVIAWTWPMLERVLILVYQCV